MHLKLQLSAYEMMYLLSSLFIDSFSSVLKKDCHYFRCTSSHKVMCICIDQSSTIICKKVLILESRKQERFRF